jgi:hypothetical protein
MLLIITLWSKESEPTPGLFVTTPGPTGLPLLLRGGEKGVVLNEKI